MLASLALYVFLGALAGALTTIAGLGGGMLLLLALAALGDPHHALAATAPALLLGNLHRVAIGHRKIAWEVAKPLALSAFPGALLGGALVAAIPEGLVAVLMLAMTGLALARSFGLQVEVPAGAALPVGFFSGALTATSGGAAILLAPFLRARALSPQAAVATTAITAATIHLARVLSYGATGMSDRDTLALGGLLAVSISLGNLLGDRLARRLGERAQGRIQDIVMVVCTGLAVLGVV